MSKVKLTLQALAGSPEFQNLLSRYPMLQHDLHAVYEASYTGIDGRQEYCLPGLTHVTSQAQERQDQKAIALFKHMRECEQGTAGLNAFAQLIKSILQDEEVA